MGKITGSVEEAIGEVNDKKREDDEEEQQQRAGRGRAQSFDEAAFISQLTLLDVQAPDKRPLQPIFPDFAKELARGGRGNNLNKRGRKNNNKAGSNYNKQLSSNGRGGGG